VRALHRDFGYLVVGLTVVYAVSGLAVNHVGDFEHGDASFERYADSYLVEPTCAGACVPPGTDAEVADWFRNKRGIEEPYKGTFRRSTDELEITFESRTVVLDTKSGHADEDGKRARFFLRAANWLHLNRGKRAWTVVADSYAILLLFLAFSGLGMIPGKRGFFYRGLGLAALGALVPVLYVLLAK
jgi:hypothetical protein